MPKQSIRKCGLIFRNMTTNAYTEITTSVFQCWTSDRVTWLNHHASERTREITLRRVSVEDDNMNPNTPVYVWSPHSFQGRRRCDSASVHRSGQATIGSPAILKARHLRRADNGRVQVRDTIRMNDCPYIMMELAVQLAAHLHALHSQEEVSFPMQLLEKVPPLQKQGI